MLLKSRRRGSLAPRQVLCAQNKGAARGARRLLDLLLTLVTGQIGGTLRRMARLAAFGVITLVFVVIALAMGAEACFLALDAALGPLRAALILAGIALVLAALASIPLWRKPAPPPPSAAATLAQLAIALGLGFLAERGGKKD